MSHTDTAIKNAKSGTKPVKLSDETLAVTGVNFYAGAILFHQCLLYFRVVIEQNIEHECFGAVWDFEPDHLRRVACDE